TAGIRLQHESDNFQHERGDAHHHLIRLGKVVAGRELLQQPLPTVVEHSAGFPVFPHLVRFSL
ncbi:MAG: hypothetical protein ABEI86_00675, partial [Halobacteriaceae archaeon]